MPSTCIVQALDKKLQAHKQSQFSGVVHIGSDRTPQWSLYFHMGRLVWAHSRLHPVRRWHRQLVRHCPQLINPQLINPQLITPQLTKEATRPAEAKAVDYEALHYSKLVAKVRRGELNRINMAKAVEDYLSEILFDIIHQGTLRKLQAKSNFKLVDRAKQFSSSLFLIVRAEQAWQQAQYDWQAWQQAELVKCSPNLSPVIGQAEKLKKKTSDAVYQHLITTIDGKQTFRDLAVQLDQPLLPLTRRIIPYIRQGLIGVVRVGDLGKPSSSDKPSVASQRKPPSAEDVPTVNMAAQAIAQPLQVSIKQLAQQPITKPPAHQKAQSIRPSGQPLAAVARPLTKVSSKAPLIIYIDDSPMDSKIMGGILQEAGFRFRSIQESTHALPLLIEHKPSLIFLDLVMPVANGYEICAQVRRVSLFKNTPIVIVTSNNTLADRVHAKMVGASGFLSKPIHREKVLKTVYKLLDNTSLPASIAPIKKKLESAKAASTGFAAAKP